MKTRVLFASLVLGVIPLRLLCATDTIQFNRDIRPLLSNACFQCHGPDERQRQAGLRLDVEDSAKGPLESESTAIVAGDAGASELMRRITANDPDIRMPPADSGKQLTAAQIDLLRRWIEQGAGWQGHWSFETPERPEPPEVAGDVEVRNPIDRFIHARRQRAGLRAASAADRELLIRRVTLDLTGLPPTLEEIDAFLNDTSDNAYENVVDRLLQSPRYGEHMARYWLDAARYGDTHGLHLDNERSIWPYRDWVIKACNDNMPFDRFTIEQLAGDLLPDPTLDQRVATGFNRCNVTTSEGGSIDAEYLVRYAVDRVNTTSMVFMGLTTGCAQCHDHKFDPISQREFYQLFSYFYSLTEKAMDGNALLPPPIVKVPSAEQRRRQSELNSTIAALNSTIAQRKAAAIPKITEWERAVIAGTKKLPEPPSDYAIYLPFDQSDGTDVASLGPDAKPGRVVGKPTWVAGKFGQAFRCDGSTHLDFGDQAAFERTDSFSYGAWINLASGAAEGVVARMDDSAAFRGYDMYIGGGRVFVHLIHQWDGNAIRVNTKTPIKLNEWHHVFATYNGSGKAEGVAIYVDGVKQALDITHNNLSGSIKTDKPLHIGRRNPGAPLDGMIDDVRIYTRELTASEVAVVAGSNPVRDIIAIAPDKRTAEQKTSLENHYLTSHDPEYVRLTRELAQTQDGIKKLESEFPATLVMEDMPNRRATFVLTRGEYDKPDQSQKVEPGVPAVFPSLPDNAPPNRLTLAHWLVNPNHPLTARVVVNRYWQRLFGTGIVKTAEDFGSQGDWPSHPELLDWLAREFIESGWNVMAMQKLMVMSATYRQSSRVTPELLARDPENRLLARGPRFRLDAEVIRDQSLFVSGLMNPTVGGKSTRPYQPMGLWHAVGYTDSNTANFTQDHGDALYRRSMYIFWKRTSPPPTMAAFDAPSREECTVRRARTNTPLQALVLLNDIQFVEAARKLAERVLTDGGDSFDRRLTFAFRTVSGRSPSSDDRRVLRRVFEQHREEYERDSRSALKLLNVGESKRNEKLNVSEHAAWTMVSNLLLNLDEVVTKN